LQQSPELDKNKSSHPTPLGFVGRMDPSEWTKIDGKVTPNFQKLIDEGGAKLRGFSFRVLKPD